LTLKISIIFGSFVAGGHEDAGAVVDKVEVFVCEGCGGKSGRLRGSIAMLDGDFGVVL